MKILFWKLISVRNGGNGLYYVFFWCMLLFLKFLFEYLYVLFVFNIYIVIYSVCLKLLLVLDLSIIGGIV